MANPVLTPISTCVCPELSHLTANASESDLKQLVILVIVQLVLSLTKMGYYKVSSIAEKKDLHSCIEDVLKSVLLATLKDSPNSALRAAYHGVLDTLSLTMVTKT
jgi:hypothetical protein